MSAGGSETPGAADVNLDLPPADFVRQMQPHERVLVQLKDTLYEGSWERVLADLQARLAGQPYVFKLSQTIGRDIAAIEKLRAYEKRQGADLSRLLQSEGEGHGH